MNHAPSKIFQKVNKKNQTASVEHNRHVSELIFYVTGYVGNERG